MPHPLTLINYFPGIEWPQICHPRAAQVLAQLYSLEHSQWLTPQKLKAQQFRQLFTVYQHAKQTVPFYQQHWESLSEIKSPEALADLWSHLPLLSRRQLQCAQETIFSTASPEGHGSITHHLTSGSTGQPVKTLGNAVTQFFWDAITIREHLWHQRDFSKSLAAIRFTDQGSASPPDGKRFNNWGRATQHIINTGPCYQLTLNCDIEQQIAWLKKVNPSYLITYPTVIESMLQYVTSAKQIPGRLQEVRSFGEIVEPELRRKIKEEFNLAFTDVYSSQEVGYIALQCSEHDHYHVQDENLLVEVLNEDNQLCKPGEIGRIVVSTLHNFSSPLIRYDLGDYAKVGEPCACGRGLQVLQYILGRQRNMLHLPDGRKRWPVFGNQESMPESIPTFFQFQIIQKSLFDIDVNVVRPSPFNSDEKISAINYLNDVLGYAFNYKFHYLDEIPRNPTGKFEDFKSEINHEK